jgi:hypothetical protein
VDENQKYFEAADLGGFMGRVCAGWGYIGCAVALLVACLTTSAGSAETMAAANASFNYPDPASKGAANYFRIAESGQAGCAICQGATFLFQYCVAREASLSSAPLRAALVEGPTVPQQRGSDVND